MKLLINPKIRALFLKILLCIPVFPVLFAMVIHLNHQNAVLFLFVSCFSMGIVVLILCWRYFEEQEQILEDAAVQIGEYILDNRRGGIECNEEGAVYHLFHEINSLVSIANAHADRERKAKEFLQDTITDISHQLKTPIAALNIYNGILQQETEDFSTVHKFAGLSEQELDRMETLVQNLLKIAKLDAGMITLEQSAENISELMGRITRSYIYQAEQEEKTIVLEGDEQTVLTCDRAWFSEAVSNIIKNAMDHTDKGDSIFIGWRESPNLIQIVVRDTGSGIHPEDLYHIFKRFYRSRFSKDIRGIGLGLSLAKAIIEAHRGSIEVSSQLGVGTVFIINFLIPTKL